MNATIMSPHSNLSAANIVGSRNAEDRSHRRACKVQGSQASRTALAVVCAALIASLLVLGAVRTIVIVADAVQCVVSIHESMLQTGEPEDRQLP